MIPASQIQEHFYIEGGFGPIQAKTELELDIRPVTIFIGPQGTGKSLVSQLLYFFRDAEYLLARYARQDTADAATRRVVESIRAGEATNRALASFLTTNKVHIGYEGIPPHAGSPKIDRKIALYEGNRKITPLKPFKDEIESWLKTWFSDLAAPGEVTAQALFVPAERTFFSRFINSDPQVLGSKTLPITMREFARILGEAADTHQRWQEPVSSATETKPPQVALELNQLVQNALGGEAKYSQRGPYARKWQWTPQASQRSIEIEMASSGQMSTWPLIFIAQAMLDWAIPQRPIFLHIEEPETHLHPSAQIAVVKALAYLVNQGFRLIITTHSLFVLYAFNNLTLAYQQLGTQPAERVPEAPVRLRPDILKAYLFADNTIKDVVDDSGQIDEGLLGSVLGDLEVEFNRLMTYNILWE